MRFVILHYHFLKNAGTSIEEILHRSFGGYFKTIDTAEREGHVSDDALLALLGSEPMLKAVSSHQLRYPLPQVPGFLFFDACFLRDPIDRLRSIYDYFREKPVEGDAVSGLARSLDLGSFLAALIEQMPWHLHDAQVNLLANGCANDAPSDRDLERALAVMLRTSFLGVVDRFRESLAAGEHFLKPVFPELRCTEEAANVLGGLDSTLEKRIARVREACDPAVFEKLLELNTRDLKLVEAARAEIGRRFNLARSGSHSPALEAGRNPPPGKKRVAAEAR